MESLPLQTTDTDQESENVSSPRLTIAQQVVLFLAFVLPALGMLQCRGWSDDTMSVEYCWFDYPWLRVYANVCYGFLLLSVLCLLIPMRAYESIVFRICKCLS